MALVRRFQSAPARTTDQWLERSLPVAAFLFVLGIWWYGSELTRFLPPISEVLAAVPEFYSNAEIYQDVAVTLQRVVGSLLVSMIAGFVAAYLIHRGRYAGRVAFVYVQLTLGVPSTIAALLSLYVFRRSELGVYVTVAVVVFPFATMILLEGIKTLDEHLEEMAKAYRVRGPQRIRHIVVPHLMPHIMGALRSENGHAWKVVVLAELFAVNTGMGYRFSQAFDRLRVVDVMLWLIAFGVLLVGTEYLVLRPLELWSQRWRLSGQTGTRPTRDMSKTAAEA